MAAVRTGRRQRPCQAFPYGGRGAPAAPSASQGGSSGGGTDGGGQGGTHGGSSGGIPSASQGGTPSASQGGTPSASQGGTDGGGQGGTPSASQGSTQEPAPKASAPALTPDTLDAQIERAEKAVQDWTHQIGPQLCMTGCL